MNKIHSITSIFLLLIFSGCEEVGVTYPGNNQDLSPTAPTGNIKWDRSNIDVDEEGRGLLPENSAAGLTIGELTATDPNPDDEFTYSISSQKMDGILLNPAYFALSSDSGFTSLKLSYGGINFEALTGSKEVVVQITVTDDSPEPKSSFFEKTIKVIDVNETPYFTNLNQIPRYADEYVDYDSPRIEWTDTDEGDNPSLSVSNLPGWLSIDTEGNIGSSDPPESNDVGNHEFLLTITDTEIDVQEEINIEVRENLAPEFTNTGSIPSSIRVGCYDDNDNIVDLNWRDLNNSAPNFNGNDVVTFTHQGTESVEWLNFDNDDNGKLFCVRAPENSDVGSTSITISLADDRPSVPLATEYSFELELIENEAPQFNNLGNFPETMAPGDTLLFDVEWQDPNNDVINFSVTENWDWFSWDNSGNIVATPDSVHMGSYDIPFNISDGCYTFTATKTLTIE